MVPLLLKGTYSRAVVTSPKALFALIRPALAKRCNTESLPKRIRLESHRTAIMKSCERMLGKAQTQSCE
ncbi:hypothetical protein GOBAR_DD10185 [Gossypium barbadense]|nr:hypothetical protein GOBAR_DD10185 [Gossypium barbadense]